MIWLVLMGCGGQPEASAPVLGCWEALPKRRSRECFAADGTYTVEGTKVGSWKGTWKLDGTRLEIAVGGMNPDVYELSTQGEHLVFSNEKRTMEMAPVTP